MQSEIVLEITPSNMEMAVNIAQRLNISVNDIISFCLKGSTNPVHRRLRNLRELLYTLKVQPTPTFH